MTITAAQTTYSSTPSKAYAGLRVVGEGDIIEPRIQGEASAVIPYGYGVIRHTTDVTKAILPTTETDKVLGLVCRSHEYMDGISYDPDATPPGIKPGANLNILRRGKIWVLAEDAVTAAGDRGWVRCTAGGAAEYVGGVTSADEGTETIDCTNQVEFQAACAAQDLVLVEVDFTRKA